MLFPITYSIPEEKIIKINTFSQKTKLVSSLIPGNTSTYVYNTEKEYYEEYQKSIFAITTKKAGWDCLRHYEIIANGCIPLFSEFDDCPPNTLALLPKDLIKEGNNLFIEIASMSEITQEGVNKINSLVTRLLKYMLEHLTTKQMAKYVLKCVNCTEAKRILYINPNHVDYLNDLMLHGFKELLGIECHDYPKVKHIYKNQNIDYTKLYGKGMTYTNLLDSSLHKECSNDDIEENIKNKYYDLIIYGLYHEGMPLYDLIKNVYEPNKIVLFCGDDIYKSNVFFDGHAHRFNKHCCDYKQWSDKGFNVFVRELQE